MTISGEIDQAAGIFVRFVSPDDYYAASANALDERGRVEVKLPGCVDCGVCELYCPTSPRAITIRPA